MGQQRSSGSGQLCGLPVKKNTASTKVHCIGTMLSSKGRRGNNYPNCLLCILTKCELAHRGNNWPHRSLSIDAFCTGTMLISSSEVQATSPLAHRGNNRPHRPLCFDVLCIFDGLCEAAGYHRGAWHFVVDVLVDLLLSFFNEAFLCNCNA